jgi:hypothetical protein
LSSEAARTASHSRTLRRKIELARGPLDAAAHALWHNPDLPRIYPAYLFQNYSIVRASVPIMQAALDCARARFTGDPVAGALSDYLTRHIPEESGHDDWVLDDLEALGYDRAEMAARLPSGAAACLAGSQYYWILHVHPVAVAGYIAVLEGNPPTEEFLEEVIARSALPRDAFSNALKHARIDPRHRDDLDEALDSLPLEPAHTALIGVSAFHTLHRLSRALLEAAAGIPSGLRRPALLS